MEMVRKFRIKSGDKLLIFFNKEMAILRKLKHPANTCGGDSPNKVCVYRIVGHERRRLGDKVFKAKKGRLFIYVKNDIVTVNRLPLDVQGGDRILIYIDGKEIR